NDREVDIRPQQVVFDTKLQYRSEDYNLEIELVLGCMTKSNSPHWGIDLYGNDRLFVHRDQTTFSDLLPRASARTLCRGFVNIKGPNVFIPWDTHKRHLNVDRDVIQILTKNKLIVDLFDNWKKVYNDIASSEVKRLIVPP